MRIVSLLPSATEILFAIGLGDHVAGVTHECDYPAEARNRKRVTECVFDSEHLSQQEIDREVRQLSEEGKSLYRINEALLAEISPDLIVTQDLCHVCAVTPHEVQRAISRLNRKPVVISLNPKLMEDVFEDMLHVAKEAGIDAGEVVNRLQTRVRRIAPASTLPNKPSVGCIEWLDPLWRTGHWVPEMVGLAGGQEVFGEIGTPSRPLSWQELREKDPEVIVLMPCGLNLMQTRAEFYKVAKRYLWSELKAFRDQQVYIVDANSYFSRSGPRLVDGLELLAEMLHPEYFTSTAPVNAYIRISLSQGD